ncbi:hypothetical protein [Paraclostridium sordellii]|uniref:hypothetical protein n=1 Tax=Paraclostridium sordellii TaxID=1505 RepID=UPI000E4C6A64|nr:hypothetical protein [Paeniclostridium sordellii]RGX09356.1 hypothetical protein DWV40_07610 [Paeniclostridium sordellii]
MCKKAKIKGYEYCLGGDFWTPNRKNFYIEFNLPTLYKTYEEAINNKVIAYFKKVKGHINLVIQEEENIIDSISWEQWWKYRIAEKKEKSYKKGLVDVCVDFIPNATNWEVLFGSENLNNEWIESIELLASRINPILNK